MHQNVQNDEKSISWKKELKKRNTSCIIKGTLIKSFDSIIS